MWKVVLLVGFLIVLTQATNDLYWTSVTEEKTSFSNQIKLSFNVAGSDVTLQLHRNNHLEKVPVFIGLTGEIKKTQQANFEIHAYADPKNGATAVVKRTRHLDGTITSEWRASFIHEGIEFALEPRKGDGLTSYNHVFYKPIRNADSLEHDGVYRPEMKAKVAEMKQMKKLMNTTSTLGKANYGVEMLLCLDYPIYKRWLDETGSHDEAVAMITFFYVHVVDNIDSRYVSIDEPDYRIYVRLRAIYIGTTPEDSHWTETTKYPGGPRGYYTDAYDTLDAFEVWINTPEVEEKVGPFDQATAFTGYTLIGGFRDDGTPRRILGLADIWGICEYRRASVNQETGQYGTTQTGAHEMGHNLGALHDGNKDNDCPSGDQYIMAISPGSLDEKNFMNTFTFSRCSREYFRDWLSYLTLSDKNCLLNDAETGIPGWDDELEKLPGQSYSYDEQCMHQFGKGSFYCAGEPNDKRMCKELECYDPEREDCTWGVEKRAYIGTTCGNKKWCSDRSACIESPDAPGAKDRCLSGDYRLKVQSNSIWLTCKEMGEQAKYDCYDRHNATCCQTCHDIRDDSKPGCEFGDHTPYCDIKLRDCYSESTRKSCCETCTPLEDAPKGCEFGDRASWCETMNTGGCYANQEVCCKTCHEKKDNDKPNCPWGDRASWCSTIKKSQCYDLETTCCETCAKYQTEIPGCEFGDRVLSCEHRECNDRDRWKKCCETCEAEIEACEEGDDASWCTTSSSSMCYESWHICCETCPKHYTGDMDCPYGDRYTWCPDYVGKNPGICESNKEVAYDCCKTCEE